MNRDGATVRIQFHAGRAADRHAGHEHVGARLDAADIAGFEAQRESALVEGRALAEQDRQHRQQHQARQDEQADFGFQT